MSDPITARKQRIEEIINRYEAKDIYPARTTPPPNFSDLKKKAASIINNPVYFSTEIAAQRCKRELDSFEEDVQSLKEAGATVARSVQDRLKTLADEASRLGNISLNIASKLVDRLQLEKSDARIVDRLISRFSMEEDFWRSEEKANIIPNAIPPLTGTAPIRVSEPSPSK